MFKWIKNFFVSSDEVKLVAEKSPGITVSPRTSSDEEVIKKSRTKRVGMASSGVRGSVSSSFTRSSRKSSDAEESYYSAAAVAAVPAFDSYSSYDSGSSFDSGSSSSSDYGSSSSGYSSGGGDFGGGGSDSSY